MIEFNNLEGKLIMKMADFYYQHGIVANGDQMIALPKDAESDYIVECIKNASIGPVKDLGDSYEMTKMTLAKFFREKIKSKLAKF